MNRHILVTLMLMCLALMLFNIGGRADQRGETGGLGGDDEPIPTTQGQAAAPLPEFSGFGVLFAGILAAVAYFSIRKQQRNFHYSD